MWSEAAQRTLYPAAEHAWAAAAGLAGRAVRPRAVRWTAAGGRVLVVAPHPDDETLGAGGAIALHAAAGDEVAVAVVTDGSASRADGLAPEEMARRRRAEVESATSILGAGRLVCLGLREGRWGEADAAAALRPLVAEAALVYAPSCVDYHPEHVAVARVVAGLVGAQTRVRVYELGVPLGPVLVNVVADVGPVVTLVERARAAFVTQRLTVAPFARLARYRARFAGLAAAELFWELRGDAYARAMVFGDWRGRRLPYRGIRGRPFTDPLAALTGQRARAALRRAAGGAEPAAGPAAAGPVPAA